MTEDRKTKLIRLVDDKARAIIEGTGERERVPLDMHIADLYLSEEDVAFIAERSEMWRDGRLAILDIPPTR